MWDTFQLTDTHYTLLGIFLGPRPRNLLNYSGGDMTQLVRKARSTPDPDRHQELVLKAQRVVLDDMDATLEAAGYRAELMQARQERSSRTMQLPSPPSPSCLDRETCG